jgi:hypothetical protein
VRVVVAAPELRAKSNLIVKKASVTGSGRFAAEISQTIERPLSPKLSLSSPELGIRRSAANFGDQRRQAHLQ